MLRGRKSTAVLMAGVCLPWLVLAVPGVASAAPAAATGVEEVEAVVVTARRRSETLFETPTTVTAVSGDTLREQGVVDIKSVVELIPNAVVPQDPQNFNTYINIRGIRQADAQAEPNFGLYRNGIYAGGQRSNLGALVDMERIEVLRGPQAGLYGRDAVGGAVNIVYATPTSDREGYVSGRYGRYQRSELQGAINIPVSDAFALRAAGWWFNQEKGEFYNVTLGKELDERDDEGVRLSARFEPNDAFKVVWVAEYQEADGPSARTYAPNGIMNFLTTSPSETFRTIRRDTPQEASSRQYYLSQDASYETSIGRFNLLAAYRNYRLTSTEDQDATAIDPASAPLSLRQVLDRREKIENVYVELLWTGQRGPLSWVAGASYFNETFDFARVFSTSIDFNALADPLFGTIACGALLGGSFTPGDPTCHTIPGGPSVAFVTSPFPAIGVRTGRGGLPNPGTDIKTKAYSAFVELTYEVTPELSLIGDLRYTHDRKSLRYTQAILPTDPASDPYLTALFANVLPPFTLKSESNFSNWAPSVGFRYKRSDNVNVYGTYATGFRAGGFNTTSTSPALIPYDQEDATNYELGVKTRWLDGRLGVNLAGFYMKQRNLVLAQADPLAPPQFNFTYLSNIGNARTYGVEFESVARFNSWLDGALSVGWLDPKFTSGSSFGVPVKGQRIPFTRKWTFNARLDADVPVADDWSLVGSANLRVEKGGVLADGVRPYEDLTKLDLTAGVKRGGLRLVGYIDNATNDRVTEFVFGNGAEAVSYGRTYGVELSWRF